MRITNIIGRGFTIRLITIAAVVASLNLLPLFLSWGDYETDGFRTVGWPMPIYMFGGLAGVHRLSILNLIIDLGFAATISFAAACYLRRGAKETVRRMGTAGSRS